MKHTLTEIKSLHEAIKKDYEAGWKNAFFWNAVFEEAYINTPSSKTDIEMLIENLLIDTLSNNLLLSDVYEMLPTLEHYKEYNDPFADLLLMAMLKTTGLGSDGEFEGYHPRHITETDEDYYNKIVTQLIVTNPMSLIVEKMIEGLVKEAL